MMGVEPAGQRAEGGQDQFALSGDEAAARHHPAAMADPELGMEMAGKLGPLFAGIGLVAQHQTVHLGLVDDRAPPQ